jgi:hypothetical protein
MEIRQIIAILILEESMTCRQSKTCVQEMSRLYMIGRCMIKKRLYLNAKSVQACSCQGNICFDHAR